MKVVDNGIGIAQVDNLFVPSYTIKADGQGIGMVQKAGRATSRGFNVDRPTL